MPWMGYCCRSTNGARTDSPSSPNPTPPSFHRPQVGLFGDVAPGEDDLSGMVPPVDEEQAEKEEAARLSELAAQKEDDKVWEVTWDGPDDMDNPKVCSLVFRVVRGWSLFENEF